MSDLEPDENMPRIEEALRGGKGTRTAITLPLLEGRSATFRAGSAPPETSRRAMAAFLALGPEARAAAAPHVLAYCRDTVEAVGEDALDGVEPPAGPDDVWRLVEPVNLTVRERDGVAFVVMEANCAWEPEHGLMVVWRDGRQLEKVSEYDGHLTNAAAFDDPGLAETVYSAAEPSFTTYKG